MSIYFWCAHACCIVPVAKRDVLALLLSVCT
jgi:hypothetical protein